MRELEPQRLNLNRVFWYLPPSPPRTSQWDTTSYTAFPASTGSTSSKCSVQRTLLAKSTVRSLVYGGDGTHSYSVLHQKEKDVACLASELASSTQRNQLEQLASRQKAELIQLRDHTTKYDRAINKILSDLKSREWEVREEESKQDKPIVEHVHVLEEGEHFTLTHGFPWTP